MIAASAYPALFLNADFRPMRAYPVSTLQWQDAVRMTIAGDVAVVQTYDQVVRSPSFSMPLPSVVALREYQRQDRPAALTRANLFLRDELCCQYCGNRFPTEELTFDHVLPRSHGGTSTWENLAAACAPCNLKKSNDPTVLPRQAPRRPTLAELNKIGLKVPQRLHQESWRDLLYWDSELEA